MALSPILKTVPLGLLALPLLIGCASLDAYRPDAVRLASQYTTIENHATTPIDPEQVDQLLLDVAHILGVQLDPTVPKARIIVTPPDRIASLHRGGAATFPGHSHAIALYFPRASLVLIPYFDRTLLGHELAHYLTDHYLKDAPRAEWEHIAHRVERKLPTVKRPVPKFPTPPTPVVVADGAPAHESLIP